ncbi:MAG: PqqD family protein [Deltaproteobacteria bacterium]|nr:PqqD family protein [Deltaproteobacteria bacterium]
MAGNPKQYPNLKIFEADDGYVVYHRETDRVHFLNHTAVLILELCNGRHSLSELIAILGESYGLDRPPEKEVVDIIDKFEQEGLIKFSSKPNTTSSASG